MCMYMNVCDRKSVCVCVCMCVFHGKLRKPEKNQIRLKRVAENEIIRVRVCMTYSEREREREREREGAWSMLCVRACN